MDEVVELANEMIDLCDGYEVFVGLTALLMAHCEIVKKNYSPSQYERLKDVSVKTIMGSIP